MGYKKGLSARVNRARMTVQTANRVHLVTKNKKIEHELEFESSKCRRM